MRIASYSFALSGDIARNLQKMEKAAEEAARAGARLLLFPECALTGYPPLHIPTASALDIPALERAQEHLRQLAVRLNIALVAGSVTYTRKWSSSGMPETSFPPLSTPPMLEKPLPAVPEPLLAPAGPKKEREYRYRNSALFFGPDGKMGAYHKRALWGWDALNFEEGDEKGVFLLDGLRVGVRICFEVRFPEFFRELYAEDVDLGLVLFCDTSEKEDVSRYQLIRAHLQTRAVENILPLMTANDISPYQTAPSAFFDPNGGIVTETQRGSEALLLADWEHKKEGFGALGRRAVSDRLTGRVYRER